MLFPQPDLVVTVDNFHIDVYMNSVVSKG